MNAGTLGFSAFTRAPDHQSTVQSVDHRSTLATLLRRKERSPHRRSLGCSAPSRPDCGAGPPHCLTQARDSAGTGCKTTPQIHLMTSNRANRTEGCLSARPHGRRAVSTLSRLASATAPSTSARASRAMAPRPWALARSATTRRRAVAAVGSSTASRRRPTSRP